MIRGVHAMFYSSQAEELRAFFRDKLELPFTDVGGGWLIFDFPEGDLGVHPTDFPGSPPSGTHSIAFYCDKLPATVEKLKKRGVVFDDGIEDRGYGYAIHLTLPGEVKVEFYEPKYRKDKPRKPKAKKTPAKKKPKATGVKKKAAPTKKKATAKKATSKRRRK